MRDYCLSLVLACSFAVPASASAPVWPGPCGPEPSTFAELTAAADFVVFGDLSDFRDRTNPQDRGSRVADLRIRKVVKNHAQLERKTKLTISSVDVFPPTEFGLVGLGEVLVFGFIDQDRPNSYWAFPSSLELERYLFGSIAAHKAQATIKLGFHFPYLNHNEPDIANDAHLVFRHASPRDHRAAARTYDINQLKVWLRDEKTPIERLRFFGYLLGRCGRREDAGVLRQLLDAPTDTRGDYGLLLGYYLLAPGEGLDYALARLGDTQKEGEVRYQALHIVRYVLDEKTRTARKRITVKRKIVIALEKALAQQDMAHFIVDELWKRRIWKHTDQVLALYGKPALDVQILSRSVIRYAVQCPDAKAKAFLSDLRKNDPKVVADEEALLKMGIPERKTKPIKP